jgi:hypothetical protein
MKSLLIILSIMSLCFFCYAQQNEVKAAVKVYGNCGMCKKTIESAAMESGATIAVWNPNSKVLKVKFDSHKTSLDSIQRTIVSKGYDTEKYRASDETYQELHKCCKYERNN